MLERAAQFMSTHARTLERRQFDGAFAGSEPAWATPALIAHYNVDGGYGHALEPDVRCSASQPLFIHFALSTHRDIGVSKFSFEWERNADFLHSIADEHGAVPYLLPSAKDAPRAGHWHADSAFAPSLIATAGVTAGLHALGVKHAWLDRATAWCLAQVAGDPQYTGHTLLNVLDLLHEVPEDTTELWERTTERLFEADHVKLDPHSTSYGLTPLQFAPTPDSPLRSFFTDDVIDAHLDALAPQQQEDGGWPISWNPPEGEATNAWRGKWTLDALRTLRAYGRV